MYSLFVIAHNNLKCPPFLGVTAWIYPIPTLFVTVLVQARVLPLPWATTELLSLPPVLPAPYSASSTVPRYAVFIE